MLYFKEFKQMCNALLTILESYFTLKYGNYTEEVFYH